MDELSLSEQDKPVTPVTIKVVEIFPDPFTGKFRFDVKSTENCWITVIVWDSEEQIVQMFLWYIKTGTNRQSLTLTDAQPLGLYRLEARGSTGKIISIIFFTRIENKQP